MKRRRRPFDFDLFVGMLGACQEAWEWVQRTGSLEKCWAACRNPGWMWWFIVELGLDDGRENHYMAERRVMKLSRPAELQMLRELWPASELKKVAMLKLQTYDFPRARELLGFIVQERP